MITGLPPHYYGLSKHRHPGVRRIKDRVKSTQERPIKLGNGITLKRLP